MSYLKSGNRISLLPIAQYCGLAAELSEAHGAGRAAAMSTAFHALCAKAPDAEAKCNQLTKEELDYVVRWTTPTDVTMDGYTLDYESADKEQPVGVSVDGEWAAEGEVITCGTLDFAWVRGERAYIGDMKKTRWASSGPDSLQLLAYGYAWAKKHGCTSFRTGIWVIEDAEWQWGEKDHYLDSFESLELWSRIASAATNRDGKASFGPHCDNCYGKLHCPEYTLPAQFADTRLSAAAVGGAIDDPAKLAELLVYAQRIKGVIEKVYELAKEAAKRGVPVVHPTTGQVFRAVPTKGRETLNQAKLFASIPEATKFIERGNPYSTYRWGKAR